MSKITPENIIAKLDRYAELVQLNAKYDLYVATGQRYDLGASIHAEMQLKALEAELLDAGMFKTTTGEVVEWARRKV
ncbi:hypothetical protein [Dechloromonas sp. H13]|uniref:hypothetical protein n=1 Tax=Dechloromonas sp. H13 TaxID=2570193 RepID=UPI001884BBEC|nr:hypothetical protein [Dechloromonas sp. H13]